MLQPEALQRDCMTRMQHYLSTSAADIDKYG